MKDEADRLEFLHRYYSECLRAADQKALIVLTFAVGVFLFLGAQPAVVVLAAAGSHGTLSEQLGGSALDAARLTLWGGAFVVSILTQWFAFSALAPRSTSSPDDHVFWDHVAVRSVADLRTEIQQAVEEQSFSDVYANVHNLAVILRAKFHALRTSTFWCFVMILAFTAYFAVPLLLGVVGLS